MKPSIRAALAVGALALASSQASASIVSPVGMSMTLALGDTALYTQDNLDGFAAAQKFGSGSGDGLDRWEVILTSASTDLLANFIVSTDSAAPIKLVTSAELWNAAHTVMITSAAAVTGSNSSITQFSALNLLAGTYYIDVLGTTGAGYQGDVSAMSAIPLPAAAWLFGSALLGFGALRRKQKAGNSDMAVA